MSMTTKTQVTFQETPASITVRFSAGPATVTKLANAIARLFLKADVSADVRVASGNAASFDGGEHSMAQSGTLGIEPPTLMPYGAGRPPTS